jgi:hypothetical protein
LKHSNPLRLAFVLLPLLAAGAGLSVAATPAPVPTPNTAKPSQRPPVSLANDVLPVMTKIGCNNGTCHGQQNGQGGFKLSLRGWDPAFDHEQITKADNGRRVFAKNPALSLLIAKPTGDAKHGGGVVLKKNGPEYNLLCDGCAKAPPPRLTRTRA